LGDTARTETTGRHTYYIEQRKDVAGKRRVQRELEATNGRLDPDLTRSSFSIRLSLNFSDAPREEDSVVGLVL
jgi:hypothetical protein